MRGIHDVGTSSLSQIVELADHRPIVEVAIKCRFTNAVEEADDADKLDEHVDANDADNKAIAANETEANKANDAVEVVEAVEAKADEANDAVEAVETIEVEANDAPDEAKGPISQRGCQFNEDNDAAANEAEVADKPNEADKAELPLGWGRRLPLRCGIFVHRG
jgi:hypothetical protein